MMNEKINVAKLDDVEISKVNGGIKQTNSHPYIPIGTLLSVPEGIPSEKQASFKGIGKRPRKRPRAI